MRKGPTQQQDVPSFEGSCAVLMSPLCKIPFFCDSKSNHVFIVLAFIAANIKLFSDSNFSHLVIFLGLKFSHREGEPVLCPFSCVPRSRSLITGGIHPFQRSFSWCLLNSDSPMIMSNVPLTRNKVIWENWRGIHYLDSTE